jgi:hypothetical protein
MTESITEQAGIERQPGVKMSFSPVYLVREGTLCIRRSASGVPMSEAMAGVVNTRNASAILQIFLYWFMAIHSSKRESKTFIIFPKSGHSTCLIIDFGETLDEVRP